MHLHSHFTNAKIKGNLFVKSPDCYAMENVSLAFRQRLKTFNVTFHSANLPTSGGIGRNAHDYGVQKRLISNGLGQEINGSSFHCLHRHWNIAMTSQENDRFRVSSLREMVLKIETACSRHSHIKNQATRPIKQIGFQ